MMEEYTQIFNNMIPEEEKYWQDSHKASEDKKLELRLGPPGEFRGFYENINSFNNGGKRVLDDDQDRFKKKTGEGIWLSNNSHEKQCKKMLLWSSSSVPSSSSTAGCSLHSSTFQREGNSKEIQEQSKGGGPSSSYLQCSTVVELQCPDKKKPCSYHAGASLPVAAATRDGTSGPHKRVAPTSVVGWPPVRSSRKNLASNNNSNPKLATDFLPDKTPTEGCTGKKPESFRNDLFVKINMEGIPIGRKINLNAYDSYEKLSIAIDELFRGLLAAQRETFDVKNIDEAKETLGSSSGVGIGEYTLVYEDSEGDRILVGDVPWHMFVSTAKRLRVLKSSELSTSRLGRGEQDSNLD